MALEVGQQLRDRYKILSVIAQGGMGAIYEATDEVLGIKVAVKENLFSQEVAIRQFKAEAQILASLRHPNLPRVTDHFEIPGQGQYLIMDFVYGADLKDLLNDKGAFSEGEAIKIGIEVCKALDYLHKRNPPVIHRDIKPGNIKISETGEVHLVDFGLAKQAIVGEQTLTGAQALTPGFAPPEQYGQGTDYRTDIYSLGATLYAAVTMEAPIDGLSRAAGNDTWINIQEKNPEISPRFNEVINKAMAIKVADRFQSAEDFLQALSSISGASRDTTVLSPDSQNLLSDSQRQPVTTGFEAAIPPKKKFPMWIPIVGLFLLVAIAGGAFLGSRFLLPLLNNENEPGITSQAMAEITEESTDQTITEVIVNDSTSTPTTAPSETPAPVIVDEEPTPDQTATLTSTPTVAATPVGGGEGIIAFASDRDNGIPQLFLIDVQTKELTQLTSFDRGACQPDWSPNGDQIIFTSPCPKEQMDYKGSRLFIMNVDGSALRPLNTIPGGDFDPDWHPFDENLIVFTSYRNNNRPQLYIYDLRDNSVVGLSPNVAYDRAPKWSPDGTLILFQTVYEGFNRVFYLNLETNRRTNISQVDMDCLNPAWSNSGEMVYYSMGASLPALTGHQFDNIIGTRFTLESPKPVWEIDFSPDDYWLAYYGLGEGSNRDLFIMLANGDLVQQLTDDSDSDFDPKWRP
jgi:eukaryotic-like serine/threonine-protein kinase